MTSPHKKQIHLLRDLIGYVIRMRPSAIATTLLGVLSSGTEIAALACLIPLSQMSAHQSISRGWVRLAHQLGHAPDVKFYALMFLGLFLLRSLTQTLSLVLTAKLNRTLIAHFSARALESFIHHLEFEQVQKESVGHFMTLAGDEANRAAQIVTALMKLVPIIALFLLYIAVLLAQSRLLVAGLALLGLIIGMALFGTFRKTHALGRRQQNESRSLNTHFIESLNGLRTVRSLNGEQFVSHRYDKMIREYARTCFTIDWLNLVSSTLPTALPAAALFLATWQLAGVVWLTTQLPAIMVGAVMILRLLPLANLGLDTALRLTADMKAAGSVAEMLEAVRVATVTENSGLLPLDEPIRRITFENVSFRYAANAPLVLDGFSTTFEKGKSYAISGPSGSGKSSMVDLLLKFFTPQSGRILVNGRDIAGLSSSALRRHISLSEQATRIFYDTVQHNVSFGRQISDEDIWQALDDVNMADFIAQLPRRAQTLMAYQGSNFSGGQRQRVGLARALLQFRDVLIMDESTSALDHITKDRIVTNIFARYRDKIVIFITHDSDILKKVDEVIHLRPAPLQETFATSAAAVHHSGAAI
jgi:ABC-type bacteriocin/lantibiotic exporter with double-glycine peptidase domain